MSDPKELYDYWMIVYRRRISVLLLMAVSVASAVVISQSLPPVYEARAAFYVPASATTKRTGTSDTDLPLPTSNQDDAKANIGILKGRDATRALNKMFPQKSLDALNKDVDFAAGRDGLIYVYVRDRNPQRAADIANAYTRYFNQFLLAALKDRLEPKVTALKSHMADVNTRLQAALLEKTQLQAKIGGPSLDSEAVELTRQRADLAREKEELNAGPHRAGDGTSSAARSSDANAVADEIEKNVAALQLQLAGKLIEDRPDHPEVRVLSERYASAQQALDAKRRRLAETELLKSKNLGHMIAKRSQQLAALPELKRQESLLDQKIQTLSSELSFLRQSFEEVSYAGVRSANQAITVETAWPPVGPVYPVVWLNAVVAFILALFSGILYAFFLDYIADVRIRVRAAQ